MKHKRLFAIILFSIIVIIVATYLLYILVFRGSPVNSEDIRIETEYQYYGGSCLDQVFVIHLYSKDDTPLNVKVNYKYEPDETGKDRLVGYEIIPRALDANLGENPDNFTIGYSPYDSGITKPTDEFDFIITIKFKDKEVRYSMAEEGIFKIHKDFETSVEDN